ncbi:Uncharacterised protein [Streptococcus dysgalactiae subsp. equisimilis]|nr:Uncharacterised protein [Streptococcus dysgalactiae subsp. equisimilis]
MALPANGAENLTMIFVVLIYSTLPKTSLPALSTIVTDGYLIKLCVMVHSVCGTLAQIDADFESLLILNIQYQLIVFG